MKTTNEKSKWSEIKSDYTDENGVTSIDAFQTPDENEDGKSIALIVNGEVYYKDYDAMTDEYAQRVIRDACKKSKNRGKQENRAIAEAIKSYLIDLACDDKLPLDMNELPVFDLEKVISDAR